MTTVASTQQTSSGASLVESYTGLSGIRKPVDQPLEKILALILGAPGVGKSRLLLDCPTGYYMNFERVSMSHPDPQCPCWPPFDESGRFRLVTWDDAVREFAVLKAMAKANQPRPTTIFIDSVPAMLELITDWIPKHAADLRLASSNDTPWEALDGRSAWTRAYGIFVEQVTSLNNHGYGVYMVAHVSEKIVPIGPDQAKSIPDLTINDGLWSRLKWKLELVAALRKSLQVEVVAKAPVKRLAYILTTSNDPLLTHILKCKYTMPDVELPATGAWTAFASAYREAARSQK